MTGQSANVQEESSAPAAIVENPANPAASPPVPAQRPGLIEVDTDEGTSNDRDSAFDAEENSITSASLTSSITDYEYANGRRYHAYKRGAYLLPNDEEEQDRLDLLHHVFLLILNGRLFVSPVSNPQRVLDVGTGTGLWAMDAADEFPSAQVIGTDLSPIQPGWVPPNVQFYIDDVENEWMYDEDDAFDLVHTRVMGGSIGDWDKFVRQAYTHLKPGGWIELQEPQSWLTSDDDTKDRVTYTNQFQEKCVEAAAKFGKDINLAHTHKQRLLDAGFVDVREDVTKVFFPPSLHRGLFLPCKPFSKSPLYRFQSGSGPRILD
jgi:SAM-dependent methyltransferase